MEHKVYSVLDYGACPGSEKFQDQAIQNALDDCFLNGGGEVVVPAGVYEVRGLRLRSNTTLHLKSGAVLRASKNIDDYFILKNDTVEPVPADELSEEGWERVNGAPKAFHIYGGRWHNAIIRIYKADNVSVIGEPGSIIDGRNCYDEKGEEYYRGPHGITVLQSEHIILKGYTIQNTGNWAHNVQHVRNFRIENVTCLAGHDGVHMTSCEDLIVKDCNFYTGDDSVAGFDNKNVLVSGCEINTACSAFRFSGTNVLVVDCHIFAPAVYFFRGFMTQEEKAEGILANMAPSTEKIKRDNMLSVFTYYADFSVDIKNLGTNIVFRDCEIDGADRFLHFNYSGNEMWQNNKPMLDIKFENITARNISMPLTAYGDKDNPVTVEIENTDFTFRSGFENNIFMQVANFKRIALRNVKIHNCAAETLIKSWSPKGEGQFSFEKLSCDIPEEKLVTYTEEVFFTKAI